MVDAVAKALVVRKRVKNIVPGVRVPLQGWKRRPRGRTPLVRGFEDVPGATWAEFAERTPGWKGTRKWRHISRANRDWERQHGPGDPEYYRATILPGLKDVPLRVLGAATGLSKTTCSQIRRGDKIPHPRHWEVLRRLFLGG